MLFKYIQCPMSIAVEIILLNITLSSTPLQPLMQDTPFGTFNLTYLKCVTFNTIILVTQASHNMYGYDFTHRNE